VKVIPLGGCGEFGLNCTCMDVGDDVIVVDCGLMLPADDMPGVDQVLPDLTYLALNRDRIRAYVLTHGHDDHVGAIPFALETAPAPVYGSAFTLTLLRQRLAEHPVPVEAELRLIEPNQPVPIGERVTLEAVRVAHSVPDSNALVFNTPEGRIAFSGDFKMKGSGVGADLPTDENRLAELGDEGVHVLLCDSTNSLVSGIAATEEDVSRALSQIFATSPGRIFIALFSTHVARMQTVCSLCERFKRRVAFDGRSLTQVVALAREHGLLDLPEDLVVSPGKAHRIPRRNLVVLMTGSQGEARSALARLANQDHAEMKLDAGDTVVLSARVIPGRERQVDRMVDRLYRLGAAVVDSRYSSTVHASGHGYREDIARMIQLLRPRTVLPIHGRYRMQMENGDIARLHGTDQVVIPDDGAVLDVRPGGVIPNGRAPVGHVLVDGRGVGDVGLPVLRARRALAHTGMVVVVLLLDAQQQTLARPPELISRGFITEGNHNKLMSSAREAVEHGISTLGPTARSDPNEVAEAARVQLRRYFRRQLNRAPVVIPLVLEM
jgi:ribonuclease J